MKLEEG